MNKEKIIALVGGGSGGHVFPLVALGEELSKKNINFIYIGSKNSLESKVVKDLKWQFADISAGKWRRYLSLKSIFQNVVDVFYFIKGFFQSVRVIRRYNVGVVFSKGGYVALPVLYAARILGCPVIVHESDSVMGISNKVGSKFAKKVLTAFDPDIFQNSDSRFIKVGVPIRSNLIQAASLKSPKKERPLLLILPGSQGSVAINHYLKKGLTTLLNRYDIVHLTGKKDFSYFETLRKQLSKEIASRYKSYSFIDRELSYYFQLADLVVVRGSATTAAEAALFSKAIYVIPIPDSANNHQQKNAKALENAGAAVVRQQYQLSDEVLVNEVSSLLQDKDKLKKLGKNLSTYFSSSDTVGKIIKEIENAIQE